jgi:hypothetical protein
VKEKEDIQLIINDEYDTHELWTLRLATKLALEPALIPVYSDRDAQYPSFSNCYASNMHTQRGGFRPPTARLTMHDFTYSSGPQRDNPWAGHPPR